MLSPEDKALISEYMGWCNHKYAKSGKLWGTGICIKCKDPLPLNHHFDLNDAALCVSRMVEKRQWYGFWLEAEDILRKDETASYNNCNETEGSLLCRWLFNADNFFQAMAAWLRSK